MPDQALTEIRRDNPDGYKRLRAMLAAFLVVALLAVCAALTVTVYGVFHASQQSQENGDLIAEVQRATELIEDCTTPGGKCYDEGNDRTAEAVVGINQGTLTVIVAALSCQADGITEQKALARCTTQRAAE